MSTRISARLDDELAARVERHRRKTGETMTALVQAALEDYVRTDSRAWRAFNDAGFIGIAKGPRTLARSTKQALTSSRKNSH